MPLNPTEYYNAIRNYWRQAISQQNLVDCDPYDGGCNGGWPQTAMSKFRISEKATF